MTNDTVATQAQFATREKIAYTLLSDRKAEIIGAFGLINEQYRGTSWYGVAHPIIFVVDARGIITHRFSQEDYRQRPDIDSILIKLDSGARR